MAIAGTWRAKNLGSAEPYDTARKWGTGINPVHGVPTEGPPLRSKPVTQLHNLHADDYPSSYGAVVPPEETPENFGYTDEDVSNVLYGYNHQTGVADRPSWGLDSDSLARQSVPEEFPSAPNIPGQPAGRFLRSINKGGFITRFTKLQTRDASPGLANKARDAGPENARVSDPSQYEMQTSLQQRDKVRSGSQTRGRANAPRHEIASRPTTMGGHRHPAISGGYRHTEMLPKEQTTERARDFVPRTGGFGPREWMEPNQMYHNSPLTRTPPDQPYSGPQTGVGYGIAGDHVYGYTSEDVVW